MSDGEEDLQDLRPIELETHRRTPPPLDEKDMAEMSQISADIDDAEKFELTFEVVDTSAVEEDVVVNHVPDEEISKILTPPSAGKMMRIGHFDGNLDEEAEEGWVNDENEEDGAKFRKPAAMQHRKSMASELLDDFHSPLPSDNTSSTSTSTNRKRLSNEPLPLETPKHGKKLHAFASELLDEFRSPLATSSSHNIPFASVVSRKRPSTEELPPKPTAPIETPKRGAMTK